MATISGLLGIYTINPINIISISGYTFKTISGTFINFVTDISSTTILNINSWVTNTTSNRFKSSYFSGFLTLSGGNISILNGNLNVSNYINNTPVGNLNYLDVNSSINNSLNYLINYCYTLSGSMKNYTSANLTYLDVNSSINNSLNYLNYYNTTLSSNLNNNLNNDINNYITLSSYIKNNTISLQNSLNYLNLYSTSLSSYINTYNSNNNNNTNSIQNSINYLNYYNITLSSSINNINNNDMNNYITLSSSIKNNTTTINNSITYLANYCNTLSSNIKNNANSNINIIDGTNAYLSINTQFFTSPYYYNNGWRFETNTSDSSLSLKPYNNNILSTSGYINGWDTTKFGFKSSGTFTSTNIINSNNITTDSISVGGISTLGGVVNVTGILTSGNLIQTSAGIYAGTILTTPGKLNVGGASTLNSVNCTSLKHYVPYFRASSPSLVMTSGNWFTHSYNTILRADFIPSSLSYTQGGAFVNNTGDTLVLSVSAWQDFAYTGTAPASRRISIIHSTFGEMSATGMNYNLADNTQVSTSAIISLYVNESFYVRGYQNSGYTITAQGNYINFTILNI